MATVLPSFSKLNLIFNRTTASLKKIVRITKSCVLFCEGIIFIVLSRNQNNNFIMTTVAQLTYIPLYADHPKEKVQDLIEFVAQHDVEVDINYLSTSVKGETEVVFELIREIYDTMSFEDDAFRFHVELLSPTKE